MATSGSPKLEAVGTQRLIDVAALDGPAVFICYAEATQQGAGAIEAAVRERYNAAHVLVGHVIDLHTVPRMFHAVARNILIAEYEKGRRRSPARRDGGRPRRHPAGLGRGLRRRAGAR